MDQSGIDIRRFLGRKNESLNFDALDIMEGARTFSRNGFHVDVSGKFSRNIALKFPVVTAPMPDVTDGHVATVTARNGGLGVIPATYDPEEQAEIVRAVKKAESRFVDRPFSLFPTDTVDMAVSAPYSNIPVVMAKGDREIVVGLVCLLGQHVKYFYTDEWKDRLINEIMVRDLDRIAVRPEDVTVNGELNFHRAAQIMRARFTPDQPVPALVVVGSENELLYLITMKDVALQEDININATRDKKGRLCVGAAILEHMTEENKQRIRMLADAEVDVIAIAQAQGWNEDMKQMTIYLKKEYPHIDVVPGNDSVGKAVLFHHKNGADGVMVGQGPGSECISGEVVGLWRPQFSTAYDCGNAAGKCDMPCTVDGGIWTPYRAFKALIVGGTAVMLARVIAQTSDSPAKEIEPGKKLYRAMGSPELVKAHSSAFQKYNPQTFIPEGTSEFLPITTSLDEFLKMFKANLERCFERFGMANLADAHSKLRKGEIMAQFKHNRETK